MNDATPPRRIWLSADDYGLSPGVNRAIRPYADRSKHLRWQAQCARAPAAATPFRREQCDESVDTARCADPARKTSGRMQFVVAAVEGRVRREEALTFDAPNRVDHLTMNIAMHVASYWSAFLSRVRECVTNDFHDALGLFVIPFWHTPGIGELRASSSKLHPLCQALSRSRRVRSPRLGRRSPAGEHRTDAPEGQARS
jgi:hypothetical protein